MPRELITIQVGQCGNQIGLKFWDKALSEHVTQHKKRKAPVYDEALSSFFRNVDSRDSNTSFDVGKPIYSLRARAVMVDMEEGPVSASLRSNLGELFSSNSIVTGQFGSGNNWAQGYRDHGKEYHDRIIESINQELEHCDSPQSFLLINSLGGGTGSGLGSYLLEQLEDYYPNIYRFVNCVIPSKDDDVNISPYNSVLSTAKLIEHADCVLPVENSALMKMIERLNLKGSKSRQYEYDSGSGGKDKDKPFDKMNNITAQMLLNLTSSMRFEGSLNVDLNEITMNLVPFPKLHFLGSSLSPLHILAGSSSTSTAVSAQAHRSAPRQLDQVFSDAFSPEYQLIDVDWRMSRYLACGLMVRGAVEMSDLRRNIERVRFNSKLKFVPWNQDGWKVGLCDVPPTDHDVSLLCLVNNCGMATSLKNMASRFNSLYTKRVYLHHYQSFLGDDTDVVMDTALENVLGIADDYSSIELKSVEQEGEGDDGGIGSSARSKIVSQW